MNEAQSLYIAGPMTGYPRYNYDAFSEAATALREAGYTVLSPHELDDNLDLRGFDPDVPGSFTTEHRHRALTADLNIVLNEADGVATLPDWQHSAGASLEVSVARAVGKSVAPATIWQAIGWGRAAMARSFR